MFFDRSGTESYKSFMSSESLKSEAQAAKVRKLGKRTLRRQYLALTLAVSMAAGPLAATPRAFAADAVSPAKITVPAAGDVVLAADEAAATPQDLLKQGIDQFNNGQYQESLETLQQVQAKADALSADEQKRLTDTMSKAEAAANSRKQARAEFQMGEDALKANKPAEAIDHYKAAADNKFADQGTRNSARQQIAVASDQAKQALGDLKAVYKEAKQQYEAGQLADARGKFEQLRAAGYKAPLFQKSPSDYIKNIDKKLAEGQPGTPAEQPAVAEKPAPSTDQTTPEKTVAVTPEKTVTPPEKTAVAPTTGESMPPTASAEEPAQPGEQQPIPREVYQTARDQYKKGDWINARKNFEAAQAAGYKAKLFEDSPATYLKRMDKKEMADAKKAEDAARRQQEADAREAERREAEAAAERDRAAQLKADAEAQARAQAEHVVATDTNTKVTPPATKETAVVVKPATAQAPVVQPTTAETAIPNATANDTTAAQKSLQDTANWERIRAEQNRYKAKQKVEAAQKAAADNKPEEALRLYNEALEFDPKNEQAAAGQREMATLTGHEVGGAGGGLAQEEQHANLQRTAISYRFNTAIDRAQAAIKAQDFVTARTQLENARVARDTEPTLFTQQEITRFNTIIADTQLALERSEDAAKNASVSATAGEAQQREAIRQREAAQQRQRAVSSLVKEAQRLVKQNDYDKALGVLDQILILDPTNDYAIGARPLVEDKANFMKQRWYREQFDQNLVKQLNSTEEKKIPYDDIYRYPANWPDIVEIREQSVKEERGENQVDSAVQAQLDRRLPEVRFDNVGFSDVVDFLRDITGANIFVNWRALEAAAIDKNAPVTARLRDVKFSKALSTILSDVGGGTVKLGYTIDEGVITISTEEDLSKNVITRVYDIRDIIFDVPEFDNAPDFSLQNTASNNQGGQGGQGGGGGGGQGGGQGGLFGGTGSGSGGTQQEAGTSKKERIDQIIKLIQDTVASETWKDNGGSVGSVKELSGQLIVTQTPENQRQLLNLLEQLRETRAIQVTIETRFLTVQRNFLEDIGMDFDFTFNRTPSAGSKWPTPISVTNNSSDFTLAPSTAAPGSIGSSATGMKLSGTFLDDFAVNFMIRATQASTTSTLLTAPRVTLFNGQRAYVLVATQQAYVSDLEPVVGNNAVSFKPQVSIVESGALLDVQATVSSDRKYVTLTLRPQLSNLVSLQAFAFQGSNAPGTGTGTGTGTPVVIDTNQTQTAGTGIIQQPILQITEVRTTVSVPDGGTLLLGGQTIAGEVEKEAGVPILSKIPFLKRLFTNRSMAKDEQVLLILVKPTIIIQREEEQRQFPLLTSKTHTGG